MAENPVLTAILARRSERGESRPNMEDLSPAMMVFLSSLTQALSHGAKNLAQYGAPEVAGLVAASAGATGAVIEAANIGKN